MDQELFSFVPVLIYLILVVGLMVVILVSVHLVSPRKKTVVKDEVPYESGMDPIGDARQHFDIQFYLIAILFLVFDVELLFLYPWAVAAYNDNGGIPGLMRSTVFWVMIVFLASLVIAFVYAWRKGVFKWR